MAAAMEGLRALLTPHPERQDILDLETANGPVGQVSLHLIIRHDL